MEWDRKPRDKSTHLWSINLWQRRQVYIVDSPFNKWIKDLNVRPDAIKLEKNTGRTLFDINLSIIFLDPYPRIMKIKQKMNTWYLIKLKSFCTATETTSRTERQPTEWEKNICKWWAWQEIKLQNFKQLRWLNKKQFNNKMGRRPK